jgi:hypothetical protein
MRLDISALNAHIFAHQLEAGAIPTRALETNRSKVAALVREGWEVRHGGTRPGCIILPRHRTLSPGVARAIAKQARWLD